MPKKKGDPTRLPESASLPIADAPTNINSSLFSNFTQQFQPEPPVPFNELQLEAPLPGPIEYQVGPSQTQENGVREYEWQKDYNFMNTFGDIGTPPLLPFIRPGDVLRVSSSFNVQRRRTPKSKRSSKSKDKEEHASTTSTSTKTITKTFHAVIPQSPAMQPGIINDTFSSNFSSGTWNSALTTLTVPSGNTYSPLNFLLPNEKQVDKQKDQQYRDSIPPTPKTPAYVDSPGFEDLVNNILNPDLPSLTVDSPNRTFFPNEFSQTHTIPNGQSIQLDLSFEDDDFVDEQQLQEETEQDDFDIFDSTYQPQF